MVLSTLSNREKYILYSTFVVILLSVIYAFLLEPIQNKWKELNQQIAVSEAKLEKSLRIISQKESIKSEYAKYIDYARRKGSDEEEIASMLGEVERLARSSQVRIIDIKPQQVKATASYRKYGIEVEAEAQVMELSKFIYELQKSNNLLKTERLQLTAKGDQQSVLKSRMLITRISVP